MVSSSHVSTTPSHSWRGGTHHTFPLLQCGVPAMGHSPTNFYNMSYSHWLQFSSSQTAPAYVPLSGCSPSGTCSSGEGTPWITSPASKPASSMGFVPQGATAPARTLLKPRFPMGLQPCSGLHLLQCGVVHELQVDL